MAPEDKFTPSAAAPQAAETAPQNFFSRLIGVWFSPGETFREIGRAPRLLMPIIFAILLGLAVSFAMTQRLNMQAMMAQMFEQAVAQGQITQEQADRQVQFAARFGTIQMLVFGTLGTLLAALIVAGIFKLVSMLMGADNTFGALFAVTLYAFIATGIISSILFVTLLYLKDPGEITFQNLGQIVSSSLGALLNLLLGEGALPKFLMALAYRVDLFTIWLISLLSIGYAAVSRRMKTSTAAAWLTGLYVIYALIASAWTALRG